jgi:ATP-binding cassette subfamily C (CFTR/MRP) protein 1
VYARTAMVLLDDIFSALDAKTEQLVFERLFSRQGLFKKNNTTVILATHAVQHLYAADFIVALGRHGAPVEQGTYQQLMAGQGYVKSLAVELRDQSNLEDMAKPTGNLTREITESVLQDDVPVFDRRLGDFSVYKYYSKRVGIASLLTFFVCQFIRFSLTSVPGS